MALKEISRDLSKIIESIRELVEIESPSFDMPGSKKVADWIAKKAAGFALENIFADGYGNHIIIRAFPSDEKPILLLGHTDTVHPIGSKEKNPTRIEGDKFYGCGIFDMKANVSLIFEVIRGLKEAGLRPKRPLNILLCCDEEVGSHSGREWVEKEALKSEYCLVFEPSAHGKCKTGRKGTGMFSLKTHGHPAHAGLEPEKGASAILEISRQIEAVHELNALERGTTVNVCTIKGGTTTNVIPAEAECTIDVRFSSMSEAQRIESELRQLRSKDERVRLELLGEINRPPMERNEKVISLFEKAKGIAAGIDFNLEETQVGGASDGNFVGAMGVPVLDGLGIMGDNAHRLDEFIFISDIEKRARLLSELIMKL